jgi:hypothetical protein
VSHRIIDSINALESAKATEKAKQDELANANKALADAQSDHAAKADALKSDIKAKGSVAVVKPDGAVDAYISDDSDTGYHVIPLLSADTSVDDGNNGGNGGGGGGNGVDGGPASGGGGNPPADSGGGFSPANPAFPGTNQPFPSETAPHATGGNPAQGGPGYPAS